MVLFYKFVEDIFQYDHSYLFSDFVDMKMVDEVELEAVVVEVDGKKAGSP